MKRKFSSENQPKMNESASAGDRTQSMDAVIEKLKEDHQKEMETLTQEKDMEILELENECEELKQQLEAKEKAMSKIVANKGEPSRYLTLAQRLTWGVEKFFSGERIQHPNLYGSYSEWYENMASLMNEEQLYFRTRTTVKDFFLTKKDFGGVKETLGLGATPDLFKHVESSKCIILEAEDFNNNMWGTNTCVILLHPSEIKKCFEMVKVNAKDIKATEWVARNIPKDIYYNNSVIFLILPYGSLER